MKKLKIFHKNKWRYIYSSDILKSVYIQDIVKIGGAVVEI